MVQKLAYILLGIIIGYFFNPLPVVWGKESKNYFPIGSKSNPMYVNSAPIILCGFCN